MEVGQDAPPVGSSPTAPTVTVAHKGWRPRETDIRLSNHTRTPKPSRAPEARSASLKAPCLPTGSNLANGEIERNGASALPVERAPPLSNDHVENLLSVAASHGEGATEGLNSTESDLSAASVESPGNPVSAHTLHETTQELVTAAELAHLANEARQAADAACADFEIAQDKADNIAAAKLKIEKIDQDSKQVRKELGID